MNVILEATRNMSEFSDYIGEAEKKLGEYSASRDPMYVIHASGKIWMAFRELVMDKAGLERSDFLHDTIIKHHANKLGMHNLWRQAHYLNLVYSSAASSNRNGTIKRIKSFINKTKKFRYENDNTKIQ